MELRRVTLLCAASALFIASWPKTANAVLVVVSAPAPRAAVTAATGTPHVSYTFFIDVGMGESIDTIEGVFTAPAGDMFQVHPVGPPHTAFTDFNALMPGLGFAADGEDDSQFEFSGIPGFHWDFIFPPMDTSTTLSAVFFDDPGTVTPGPKSVDFDLAHVIVPATSGGFFEINYSLVGSSDIVTVEGTFGVIPEASQVIAGTVLMVGVAGLSLVRRRLSKRGALAV